jgi:hypothetical protein
MCSVSAATLASAAFLAGCSQDKTPSATLAPAPAPVKQEVQPVSDVKPVPLPAGPYALAFEVNRRPDGEILIASSQMRLSGKDGIRILDYKWKTEPEITLVSGDKSLPVGKMKFG